MGATTANTVTTPPEALLATGRRVLELEAAEIARAATRLDVAFAQAVALLQDARGRVIVTGIGKSGLIARKIAATFTSTGSPASYLHPVDSLHGDLGIVGRDDVAVVLSKSGESEELTGLIVALQRMAVPIIAITAVPASFLGRAAKVSLDASVREEACPHDLAPTTSTAVALALGDALAMALLEARGFGPDDFAVLHPGGSLGRRLLLRVRDVMVPPAGNVSPATPMREVAVTLARHRGMATVTEGDVLVGVFTAGDFTRLAQHGGDWFGTPVGEVMTRQPRVSSPDEFAGAAVAIMERHGILVLPVLDGTRLVGVVHLHDLMLAGAV